MAEQKESASTLSALLVEITNLFIHGRFTCMLCNGEEGGKAEAVTQFTSIMDYFLMHTHLLQSLSGSA